MNERLDQFFKKSFLKDLLNVETITDISYNGENIYYQDNIEGRKKYDKEISSKEAYEFIRQIANLTDSQFSVSSPILDISIDKYRINAVHYILARKNREQAINFSIRIGYLSLRIKNDGSFISKKGIELIDLFLANNQSIIIGGQTSSGKTEFQKFLLSRLKENTRIVILDNVDELETDDFLKNIDSQTWLLKNNIDLTFDDLVRNALRNNPDWLIVSEARGEEMLSILNSAMSGHSTISTIHAKDSSFIYRRMGRMCLLKNENLKYNEVLEDIYDHFKLVIYVEKEVGNDGHINRYVKKIATNYKNKYYELFSYPSNYYLLPEELKVELKLSNKDFINFNKMWANKDMKGEINEKEAKFKKPKFNENSPLLTS